MEKRYIRAGKASSLLLAAVLACSSAWAQTPGGSAASASAASAPVSADGDAILSAEVKQNEHGQWFVVCEVRIGPFKKGLLAARSITATPVVDPKQMPEDGRYFGNHVVLQTKVGQQTVTYELFPPLREIAQTDWVAVWLSPGPFDDDKGHTKLIKQTIKWPDRATQQIDTNIRLHGVTKTLDVAIGMIDGGMAEDAKRWLERLLQKDGKLVQAHIELARVAMKTNWGQEGLHQAQAYLASALAIEPDNVNAFILRGYVLVHQGRYKAAEADFARAEQARPRNLWLWSNWGELLAKQGKTDEAIKMYRRGLEHPVTHDTYDRARQDAYMALLSIYHKRRDLGAMDKLHHQRTSDYGNNGCFPADYALFKLRALGDAAAAIALLKDLPQVDCSVNRRETLGLAYYLLWAQSSGAESTDALHQARVYFPSGTKLFYRLAESDQTVDAAKRLAKLDDSVNQKNNQGMTALAHALAQRDLDVARRLLKIGASPTVTIGHEGMPLALIPVFAEDLDGIRLMRQAGVDYSKLNFQGMTPLAIARRSGNKKLMDLLTQKSPKT